MRDLGQDLGPDPASAGTAGGTALPAPTLQEIHVFTRRLAADAVGLKDPDRIDRLRALEELRCSTEAAQVETTADFVASQRQAAADRGVPADRRDRGLAAQVALARRESPRRGHHDLGLAMLLRRGELPATRAAFRAGRIDRWKTTLIARETGCLSAEHRAFVDEQLCGDPEVVEGLSVNELIGRLRKAAAQLDPAGVAERRRKAEADRHTSLRLAPDTMTWFGALLPVKAGVAVQATLERAARTAQAAGDPRTVRQLMADLLVDRVVHARVVHPGLADAATSPTNTTSSSGTSWASGGNATGDTGSGSPRGASSRVPVMVNLIVSNTVLFGEDEGTGWVEDHGPVPGDLIREWITENLDDDVTTWWRRVYEQPATGHLVAMDSVARFFPAKLAAFLKIRDRRCRNKWCGARIRHIDHIKASAGGGPTTAENGQGLCEACNHAKQADGWTAKPRPGPRHTVETTTPTGHTYTSEAEPL